MLPLLRVPIRAVHREILDKILPSGGSGNVIALCASAVGPRKSAPGKETTNDQQGQRESGTAGSESSRARAPDQPVPGGRGLQPPDRRRRRGRRVTRL